jgi:hypothetical protein
MGVAFVTAAVILSVVFTVLLVNAHAVPADLRGVQDVAS